MKILSKALVLPILAATVLAPSLRAQLVVVPNELAMVPGNMPINVPSADATLRYMLMYDASQFGILAGPSYLTQFKFRPVATEGPLGPRQTVFRLYASTTKRSVAGMSTSFIQNLGPDNTLVFEGTITLATENLPGPEDTMKFDIVTPLTIPFLYDPADGNLLLDLQISSDTGQAIQYDGVTANPAARGLANFDSDTATSGIFVPPQVTQFTFEALPMLTIQTSQVQVSWNSKSNQTYQVQYRSALTTNHWAPLVDCIRATNLTSSIFDPIAVGQPQRFYRVVLSNCVP